MQVQAQLEAVGFVVKQDVREYANLEEEMLNGGFDAVIVSRNTMIDTGDPLSALMQDFSCEGGNNISQLCDPEIDKIFTEGLTFPPGPERQQATMNAENVATETANMRRRPNRSVSTPAASEPMSMPTSARLPTRPACSRVTPQFCGPMKPGSVAP